MTVATTGERLRARVREDFGVALVSVDRLAYGADAAAELWRGTSADGVAYAVKRSGGGTPAGLLVSAHLAEQGVPGIARPVPTPDGRLWSDHEGSRLALLPWVSDDRALAGGMTAAHWTSYGVLLARVHATAVTDPLAERLPHEDHDHDRVAAAVRALDTRLQGPGGRPVRGETSDPLAQALVQEWCAAAGPLATLMAGADDLGRELRARPADDVVCHGDPHLGNVMVGEAAQVWLVDWDDAVLAPRERDLMFVLGGVLAFAPVSPEQQSWFFAGYGPAELDPVRLAYYRCVRALWDLVDPAAQVVDVDGHSGCERADALDIVRGVLSPTGLVELALSSLRELDRGPGWPHHD